MVAPWKLCQRCCCRYGCFPLLIVPILTLGCCLSLYSSAGCKFINIDFDFDPTNEGWEASSPYSVGPLFYHNESVHHDSMYREFLHSGCVAYSDQFYDDFINGDRTFKMIRVMTLISCGSSALAMFVSWIFVISPIPVDLLWAGLLLPAVMAAFISEGSKFLIFDTALCRSSMWYRGSLEIPEKAESCSMGDTAWFACAAGILHFWALVCVCLRAPERRSYVRSDGPPSSSMKKIEEERDEEILEETSDDNGIIDDADEMIFLKLESGNLNAAATKGIVDDKVNNNNDTSKKSIPYEDFGEIMNDKQCANDLSMGFVPIEANMSTEQQCCSPMSTGNHAASPEPVPNVQAREANLAISPVDCIIEGFDVATDLSQIDVCRTMLYSPTQKPLELEAAVVDDEQPITARTEAEKVPIQIDTPNSSELLQQCQAALQKNNHSTNEEDTEAQST